VASDGCDHDQCHEHGDQHDCGDDVAASCPLLPGEEVLPLRHGQWAMAVGLSPLGRRCQFRVLQESGATFGEERKLLVSQDCGVSCGDNACAVRGGRCDRAVCGERSIESVDVT
jgi:hypothetical protein